VVCADAADAPSINTAIVIIVKTENFFITHPPRRFEL